MDVRKEIQRTHQQNKALHLYFQMVADTLNEAGLDIRAVLRPEVEIPWRGDLVKEYIWRPIQKIQTTKESTIQLTTKELQEVWETVNRHLGEKLGEHVPFPSIEEIMNHQREQEYEQKTNR